MKIWCQSCGAFGKDPIWSDYEEGLKKRAKEVARRDTAVEFYAQEMTIPGIDRYYASQNVCAVQSIKNAIRAEREGYDAFVMISTPDPGFQEIREVVDIPVVFILENSLHFAMMLAPRFAFITHGPGILSLLNVRTRQYGLAERMAPGGYFDFTYTDWPELYGHPERYFDIITRKAREIITSGANILIPAALPLGVWFIQQGLTEIDGARILDSFGCALKMAEVLVDLKKVGISRIKYGPQQREISEAMRKLYATG